jgi:hypothetical protein
METSKVDQLNIGLIFLSLVAAFWLPFELFLFSYAVLGPLHYMTEINWLEERSYFSKSRWTPWILGSFVLLICLGSFFAEGVKNPQLAGFRNLVGQISLGSFFEWLSLHSVDLAFVSFAVAVSLTVFRDWKFRTLIVLLAIALAVAFHASSNYLLWVGSMLPTFIHVTLFTGLFMLYGALKSNSRMGIWAVLAFVVAHILIVKWPIEPTAYFMTKAGVTYETFAQSGFDMVLYQLSLVLGLSQPNSTFGLNSELGIRLGIFLAFAYTYHYLNWFSKTSIIKWHLVPRRKLIQAGVVWIASIALYLIDYRVGLLALLFLSMLHVVFEFPLNYISIAGILSEIPKRLKY